ncbi:hypothetical protein BgiBS90_019225 [Biomphalaria glabrata]|nr:hypothetical protein BgiBS90_019225 [Biomphalaria glabrata]
MQQRCKQSPMRHSHPHPTVSHPGDRSLQVQVSNVFLLTDHIGNFRFYLSFSHTIQPNIHCVIMDGTGNITVQTHEFNQRDSLTSCLTGILADTDTIILNSFLKKPKDIPTSKLILKIEVKPSESKAYAVIYQAELTRCLSRTLYDIECAEIDGEHFNITFKYNAKLQYSEAYFKVSVSYQRNFFPGNSIVLPHVYDTKNLGFFLNNVKLPPTPYKCSTAPIDNGDLHFCCEQSKIFHTTAVIWLNGVNVSSSERCASYKLQPAGNVKTLEFECNFCGVQRLKTSCFMDDDLNNKIKSSYTLGKSQDAERIKGDDTNILLQDILLLVTVLPCLILLVVVLTCILQLCQKKSKDDDKNKATKPVGKETQTQNRPSNRSNQSDNDKNKATKPVYVKTQTQNRPSNRSNQSESAGLTSTEYNQQDNEEPPDILENTFIKMVIYPNDKQPSWRNMPHKMLTDS